MATQRDMEKWDRRIIERSVQAGHISAKERDAHLAKLPDVSEKAVPIDEHQPLEPHTETSTEGADPE